MTSQIKKDGSSFRDPSGVVFNHNDHLFRQINFFYKDDYEHLIESGLYKDLVENELIIPHKESPNTKPPFPNGYKVIEPDNVPFISYPYEWSFSQLKDAALLTLEIQKKALDFGMVLKDASAYNIQFSNGHPVLIDTLSFTKYIPDRAWVAYRQFCQHFLCPLALMRYKEVQLNRLLQIFIDGIPVDMASRLLPARTWLSPAILFHIHLHALSQKNLSQRVNATNLQQGKVKKAALVELCSNLQNTIRRLEWKPDKTYWADYYQNTNYQESSFDFKKNFISEVTGKLNPEVVWDIGANTGIFSRECAASESCTIISCDNDPGAIEINYLECRKKEFNNILPLVIDITNPSPTIGWQNSERTSFLDRGPADMVLALALIHHLAISNNVPFDKISTLFSKIGKHLVIEFISKNDSQVQKLLSTRDDIFSDYSLEKFLSAFSKDFLLMQRAKILDSERELFLFSRK